MQVRLESRVYFLNFGSTSVLGEDYEQNGVEKKRGRVRLNRLGGRKRGGLYGGREAEIGRSLESTRVQESRNRESTEGSENSIRIVAPARGVFFPDSPSLFFFGGFSYFFFPSYLSDLSAFSLFLFLCVYLCVCIPFVCACVFGNSMCVGR